MVENTSGGILLFNKEGGRDGGKEGGSRRQIRKKRDGGRKRAGERKER